MGDKAMVSVVWDQGQEAGIGIIWEVKNFPRLGVP